MKSFVRCIFLVRGRVWRFATVREEWGWSVPVPSGTSMDRSGPRVVPDNSSRRHVGSKAGLTPCSGLRFKTTKKTAC